MARLPGNENLASVSGRELHSLRDINSLPEREKRTLLVRLLPHRLFSLLGIDRRDAVADPRITIIAPDRLGFVRIDVRSAGDRDPLFFVELADNGFRQMELSFCIICDPASPRFNVDRDAAGRDNWFAALGRNVPEELRAMKAGLFPNQVRRGLGLFADFFPRFERFVDSLGMEMIVAEPLTYDNAIRYEKYGFDYLTGRRLMREIDEGFRPGGRYHARLDGSSPFRMSGMARTVRGRSWAIHDGILDVPWDGVRIYKTVGESAGIDTFPGREFEEDKPSQR
jgi:hypothetical protein